MGMNHRDFGTLDCILAPDSVYDQGTFAEHLKKIGQMIFMISTETEKK